MRGSAVILAGQTREPPQLAAPRRRRVRIASPAAANSSAPPAPGQPGPLNRPREPAASSTKPAMEASANRTSFQTMAG